LVFDESALPAEGEEVMRLLRALSSLDDVIRWSYEDAGPPESVQRVTQGSWSVPLGWLEVHELEVDPDAQRRFASHSVCYTVDGESAAQSMIGGDVGRGDMATWDDSYPELSTEDGSAARRAASIALGAADAAKADLLVTTRAFLLRGQWPFRDRDTVACTPTDAAALIGQFLRSRGVYMGWFDEGQWRMSFDRLGYFWLTSRALLPEGWRWFSHCVYSETEEQSDLVVLAQSVFQRLARVLGRLDDLRWATSLEPEKGMADEAVTSLDYILIDLAGAFDAAARVAHRVLELPGSEYLAQWRGRKPWSQALRTACPDLAALVAPQRPGGDLLEILACLRNTVHGAGLQPTRFQGNTRRQDKVAIALPHADAERIKAILKRRGWEGGIGLNEFSENRTYVSPEDLGLHLIREAVPLLNRLMTETPVERLGTIPDGAEHSWDMDPTNMFARQHQRSVLLQFGLADLVDPDQGPT
jgi:hypothetical protein